MSNQQTITFTTLAQTKMILHSSKNPTHQVHGILLGRFQTDNQKSAPTLIIEDVLPTFHSSPTKPILDMSLTISDSHCSLKNDGLMIVGWYCANETMMLPSSSSSSSSTAVVEGEEKEDVASEENADDEDYPNRVALRIVSSIHSKLSSSSSLPAHSEAVVVLVRNSAVLELVREDEEQQQQEDGGCCGISVFGRDGTGRWLRRISNEYVGMKERSISSVDVVRDVVERMDEFPIYDFEDHMLGRSGADYGIGDDDGERDWVRNFVVADHVKKMVK